MFGSVLRSALTLLSSGLLSDSRRTPGGFCRSRRPASSFSIGFWGLWEGLRKAVSVSGCFCWGWLGSLYSRMGGLIR